MITYTTKLKTKTLDRSSFLDTLIEVSLNQNPAGYSSKEKYDLLITNGNKSLSVADFSQEGIIASKLTEHVEETVFITEAIFNFLSDEIIIRQDRKGFDYKKCQKIPVIVTELSNRGFISDDGVFCVASYPHTIEYGQSLIAAEAILKKKSYYLPIVYVSMDTWGSYPINVSSLAANLEGRAHVLKEADVRTSLYLKDKTVGQNPYRGAVGIYYPSENTSTFKDVRLDTRGHNPDKMLSLIERYINTYMTNQNWGKYSSFDAIANYKLADEAVVAKEEKALAKKNERDAKTELQKVYDGFGDDLQKYEFKISELERRNASLEAELAGLRGKYNNSGENAVLMVFGTEHEYYPGEIKDSVLDALNNSSKDLIENSRRKNIIQDLLSANGYENKQGERIKKIKSLLRGKSRLTEQDKKALEDFGFVFKDGKTHYKLWYFDRPEYAVSISKTASDSRTGDNCASEIVQKML